MPYRVYGFFEHDVGAGSKPARPWFNALSGIFTIPGRLHLVISACCARTPYHGSRDGEDAVPYGCPIGNMVYRRGRFQTCPPMVQCAFGYIYHPGTFAPRNLGMLCKDTISRVTGRLHLVTSVCCARTPSPTDALLGIYVP